MFEQCIIPDILIQLYVFTACNDSSWENFVTDVRLKIGSFSLWHTILIATS